MEPATNDYFVEIENRASRTRGTSARLYSWIFGITIRHSGQSRDPATAAPPLHANPGPRTDRHQGAQLRELDRQLCHVPELARAVVLRLLLVQLDADVAHNAGVPRTLIANRYFYWNTHFASHPLRHSAVLDTQASGRPSIVGPSALSPLASPRDCLPWRRSDSRSDKRFEKITYQTAAPELELLTQQALRERRAFFAKSVCGFRVP